MNKELREKLEKTIRIKVCWALYNEKQRKAILDTMVEVLSSIPTQKEETKIEISEKITFDDKQELFDKFCYKSDNDGDLLELYNVKIMEFDEFNEAIEFYSKGLSVPQPLKPLSDEEIEKIAAIEYPDRIIEGPNINRNVYIKGIKKGLSLPVDNTVSECKECMNYRGEVEMLENDNTNLDGIITELQANVINLTSQLSLYKEQSKSAFGLIDVIHSWLKEKVPTKFVDISKVSGLIYDFKKLHKQP